MRQLRECKEGVKPIRKARSLKEAQSDIAHDHGVHIHYDWRKNNLLSTGQFSLGMDSTPAYVKAVFENDHSLQDALPEVADIYQSSYPDKVHFFIKNEDIKSKEDAKVLGQKIVDEFAKRGIELRHTVNDLFLYPDYKGNHILYMRVLNVPDEAFKDGVYPGYKVTPIRKYNRHVKEII